MHFTCFEMKRDGEGNGSQLRITFRIEWDITKQKKRTFEFDNNTNKLIIENRALHLYLDTNDWARQFKLTTPKLAPEYDGKQKTGKKEKEQNDLK